MFRITIGGLRRNTRALSLFAVFYVSFGLLLSCNQERLIYQPWTKDFDDCPELLDAERISFEGTRMYFKDNGPWIAVLYHGNAGSACDRALYAQLFEESGYSYVLPEYAGYSNDVVRPTHDVIKNDVRHVIDFLAHEGYSDVVIVGESIGTGAAAYHVSLSPPSRLMLISPFTSLTDIARRRFWFYPVSLLVRNAFDNVRLLADYRGPILVLHGDQDDIIPERLGRKLFVSLPSSEKRMVVVHGAGHNTMFAFPETFTAIRSFLRTELPL